MKPLAGRRVLITRPGRQAGELRSQLEDLGAEVITVPVVTIAPPDDRGPLIEALTHLERYDWVVVTSVNGVEAVRLQMQSLNLPPSALSDRNLAAIGPATANALAKAFRTPDLVPSEYVSDAISAALPDVRGLRFLLARADLARKELAETLTANGAEVDEVVAYRIVRDLEATLPDEAPDAITLTSSEIVRATWDLAGRQGKRDWFASVPLVCIGPITAATVRELGFEPFAVAEVYTTAGLIEALVRCFGKETTHA